MCRKRAERDGSAVIKSAAGAEPAALVANDMLSNA
jgi:hypothetical protein